MKPPLRVVLSALVLVVGIVQTASGQEDSLSPRLVVCGGGSLPDVVYERFRELAGPQPRLVVIPTASRRDPDMHEVQKLWNARGFDEVCVLHTSDRDVASSVEFVAPLKQATAVWFGGGLQRRIADAYVGTLVEQELHAVLQRGGVVGGTSAGAAIQSRVMIASGRGEPDISVGLDLLPGTIVDQHFLKRNRIPRLLSAVRAHPQRIGIGIDEGTALVLADGQAQVVGRSYVLRVASIDGELRIDAFGEGQTIPLRDP
jgi:cyanophycinase